MKKYIKYLVDTRFILIHMLLLNFLMSTYPLLIWGISQGSSMPLILLKIITGIVCYCFIYGILHIGNDKFLKENYEYCTLIQKIKFNIITSVLFIIEIIMFACIIGE